jgi:hypothetical protein
MEKKQEIGNGIHQKIIISNATIEKKSITEAQSSKRHRTTLSCMKTVRKWQKDAASATGAPRHTQ